MAAYDRQGMKQDAGSLEERLVRYSGERRWGPVTDGLKESKGEAVDTSAEEGDIEEGAEQLSIGGFLKKNGGRSGVRDFQTEEHQVLGVMWKSDRNKRSSNTYLPGFAQDCPDFSTGSLTS